MEITTFRSEGKYSDSRHPDEVKYVRTVEEDLARRDFTVNAMAYAPSSGLIDLYGGLSDLKNGILRCVGDPEQRFSEDALRIMRALRFLSVKGFRPDPALDAAIHQCRDQLKMISAERITAEFMKFLTGGSAAFLLDTYRDVFAVMIPELKPMFDFEQHSPFHNRDVWHHTLAAVNFIEPDPELRLTMLLHDIAKPQVARFDETGRGHFRGHPERSAVMAEEILRRLRFSRESIRRVTVLIRYHDSRFGDDRILLRKILRDLGEETIRDLMKVQRADAAGKYDKYMPSAEERIESVLTTLDSILRDGDCFTLRMLAVSGDDLQEAGFAKGRLIGEILQRLLEEVIEERLPNERAALLEAASEWREYDG